MDRLGLGAREMTARNPRLIYVSLPGFLSDDPRAGMPAWEGVLGAATGMVAADTSTSTTVGETFDGSSGGSTSTGVDPTTGSSGDPGCSGAADTSERGYADGTESSARETSARRLTQPERSRDEESAVPGDWHKNCRGCWLGAERRAAKRG